MLFYPGHTIQEVQARHSNFYKLSLSDGLAGRLAFRAKGEKYDGKQIMDMVRQNSSPFRASWDVKTLIREIEEKLNTQVTDIPIIDKGSNNYVGRHFYTRRCIF